MQNINNAIINVETYFKVILPPLLIHCNGTKIGVSYLRNCED
jgi:hypothetical protein